MRRGFTLIELLVVMAIIAILIALAIPQYNKYRANAMLSNVQNYTKSIANHVVALATTAGQNPDCANLTTIYVTREWDENNKLLTLKACKDANCNTVCDQLKIDAPDWVNSIVTKSGSNDYITVEIRANEVALSDGYIGVESTYQIKGSDGNTYTLGCKYDGKTLDDLDSDNKKVCYLP